MKFSSFNKLLINTIIGVTAFCASGFATNLTRENAYLVHATNYFPANGDMIPRSIPKAEDIQSDDVAIFTIAQHCMPQLRNTLHWCLNSVPYPHQLEDKREINRGQYRYVVIAPLTEFNFIASGYWQAVK